MAQRTQYYLEKHNLSQILSDAVNQCVASKSPQPLTFLASHFTRESKDNGQIRKIVGNEVLTTNGQPNLEAEVFCLYNGVTKSLGQSDVGLGREKGEDELVDLLDQEERFNSKGLRKAAQSVTSAISPLLIGHDVRDQAGCDEILMNSDPTPNKATVGGNAISVVSMAIASAAANLVGTSEFHYIRSLAKRETNENFKIPTPSVICLQTGKHRAEGAVGGMRINEISIVAARDAPLDIAVENLIAVSKSLETILHAKFKDTVRVTDDGAFAAPIEKIEEAVALIKEATAAARREIGVDIFIGIDFSANFCYNAETRNYNFDGTDISSENLADFVDKLVTSHPYIVYIEDIAAISDADTWRKVTQKVMAKVTVVGDDLYRSNFHLITTGIEQGWANGASLKLTQCGTLTSALTSAAAIQAANGRVVLSGRTFDSFNSTFAADLAVGIEAWLFKGGGLKKQEKLRMLNRLVKIDREIRAEGLHDRWQPAPNPDAAAPVDLKGKKPVTPAKKK